MTPKIALNGFDMTIGLIDIEKAKGYNVPNLTKNKNVKGRIDA